MLKSLSQYIKDKLGISENEARLNQLEAKSEQQYRFLLSLHQLLNTEALALNPTIEKEVMAKISKEFGINSFNTTVHKNDIMLAYHLYQTAPDVVWGLHSYFRVGVKAVFEIHKICNSLGVEPSKILDFGSGYGRMSRFLPHYFNAEVIPSDIKPESIKFQKEALGFKGFYHNSKAESFSDQNVDLIVAISVFSHLKVDNAKAWFKKLMNTLKPGGAMVFTYHDISDSNHKGLEHYFQEQNEDNIVPISKDYISDTSEYGVCFYAKNHLEEFFKKQSWDFKFLDTQLAKTQKAFILFK